MSDGLRFVTFPREDDDFARDVHESSSRINATVAPSNETLDELLTELRTTYPQAEIRQQDGLASFDSVPLTWYVYRDGLNNH